MSIDQSETRKRSRSELARFGQIWSDLVKEFKPITALRAAARTNHNRVSRHSRVPETGFKWGGYVTVKIIPHPHGAFCTRGIPPFIARSGDVNFGDSLGITAFDVLTRRSPGGGGGVERYSDGHSIRHRPFVHPI
jgi:hypothetical protein